MRRLILALTFTLLSIASFGQFNDTAALNTYIRDNIKDKRPEKVTAEQIQTGLLGITNLFSWFNTLINDSLRARPTLIATDQRYKPIGYTPTWESIIGKPSSFTPATHTHTFSDLPGLDAAINGKEDIANKSTSIALGNSNSLYPSQLAVKTYVDNIVSSNISNYIPLSQRGAVNGVATIGATGKIPVSQISLTTSDVPEGMSLYFSNSRVQSFGDTRYVLLSRSLSVGTGLTGGGDLTADRSFNLDFSYLDDRYLSGYKQRAAVRVATTANITLSAPQTIDGVSVVAGDRVLVKNQTTGSQNGIYVVASGSWTRAADFDQGTAGEIEQGSQIFVQEGTTNNKTGWSLATGGTITVDVTALAFIQYSGANSYSAGGGLSLSGNTFSAQSASSLWNANKLQSIGLSTTAPTWSQLLRYDGTNWAPWTPNYLTGELDAVSQSKTIAVSAGTGINVTGGAQTVGNNPAFTVALNATTSEVPEGSNLYWTNARGDARYPLLSGAYANPSWLTSLPWSKITGAPAFITGNQTITATGDVTGSGTTALPLTLANTGVSAGTYRSLTVNAKGLVTGGTNPTTLAGYGITDAAPAAGSGNYIQNNTSLQSANSTITGVSTAGKFSTYGQPGALRDLELYTGTTGTSTAANLRWSISRLTTEAAGNVGNDFAISRFDNAGTFISNSLTIERSTGLLTIPALRANTGSGTVRAGANSLQYFYDTDANTRLGYVGDVSGHMYLVSDNGQINLRPGATNQVFNLSATALTLSTGIFTLTNATSNAINFNTFGTAGPAFTNRSVGTKLVLNASINASQTDYATGIETSHIWNSVPQNTSSLGFKWYGGTTEVSRLDGTGSQQWNGSGRFKGWGGPANSGPAAEIGMPVGYAIFAGIDRTTTATYYPTVLRGGSGSNDPSGKDFRIDGSGYGFLGIPNFLSLGTNASGYVINTAGNFLQNQTNIAQSGVGFWTAGAGIASRFAAHSPVASTPGDLGFYEGSSAAGVNLRWRFTRSTAEATGDVGNNLLLQAFSNTGTLLNTPISITRSTGIVTTAQGLTTLNLTALPSSDLAYNSDDAHRFNINGTERVTISPDGILSVGNSTPSLARSSPLQVQGNVWATDAYILGTGNAPVGEFGLSGSADVFVRTMGTGNVLLQTSGGTVRAAVNGTTGNFEIANQVKISGGTPGAGKVLTSDASGLATWSSGNVKSIRVITASYTATTDDYTIINRATTGTPVLTLPAASSNTGREYVIVDEAANITANGLAFSPGVVFRGTTYTSWVNAALSATSRITVQSDGTNWIITSQP